MDIRKRLAKAVYEEISKGIDPDSIAVMAHRVTWEMAEENNKLHEKSARRGKKLSQIQTLIMKKPFTERTAIEQRVIDIIFENVYSDDDEYD